MHRTTEILNTQRRQIAPLGGSHASLASILPVLALFVMPLSAQAFHEGWETAQLATYTPDVDFVLPADAGTWILGDTVSSFPDCGLTPHTVEILATSEGQTLRLTSNDSNSSCADNIWVVLFHGSVIDQPGFNEEFSVPVKPDTIISFKESGTLLAPRDGVSDSCLVPPCFDNVSLNVEVSTGSALTYVFQRPPEATPNTNHDFYREIFLDPAGGSYSRNLFDDLSTIPNFNPNDARVVTLDFSIDEHGSATIDDIFIGTGTVEPVLQIQANGVDGPLTVGQGENLSVTVEMSPFGWAGTDADWWLAAETPFGWFQYEYQTNSWIYAGTSYTEVTPTHQGALFELPTMQVVNANVLPEGPYTIFFVVDTNMNGVLDLDRMRFDVVSVTVGN